MKKLFAIAIMALSVAAQAAPASDAPAADCEGVKVATGPKGKGYSTLFADINKLIGS